MGHNNNLLHKTHNYAPADDLDSLIQYHLLAFLLHNVFLCEISL